MTDVLKGNFETKVRVVVNGEDGESLEQEFEREALKRLGGSICFVSKKKVLWRPDSDT